jgi:hypothetical protein
MAKDKQIEEAVYNLSWDLPPNNRFTPWPIDVRLREDRRDEVHGERPAPPGTTRDDS